LQNVYGKNWRKVKQKPQFLQRSSRGFGVLVRMLNFGATQKSVDVWLCTLNFGIVQKSVGVRLCALNFGTAQKKFGEQVRTLKFGVVRKNVGVRVRTLNLALRGVHTHNNGMHGVCSIGRSHRSLVGAHAMWVYVVTQQFS
jgi:hypothetical protein